MVTELALILGAQTAAAHTVDETAKDFVSLLQKFGEGLEDDVDPLAFSAIAAFGDGLNDLEMAAAVGYFVAMGNGHPDLLARADFIAPAAADDGIARALEQLEIL